MRARSAKHDPSKRRRGAAATELALILPVLVTIVLGCVDYGRFAYQLIAVTNAARAGAANGIMNNSTASTLSTWKANVIAAATAEMASQDGYSSANLTVTVPTPSVDSNGLRRVTVIVSYQFNTIVNWNWPLLSIPHTSTLTRQIVLRQIR